MRTRRTDTEAHAAQQRLSGWEALVLRDLHGVLVYTFRDYNVPGVAAAIARAQRGGRHFSMLTGDELSSALECAQATQLVPVDCKAAPEYDHLNAVTDLARLLAAPPMARARSRALASMDACWSFAAVLTFFPIKIIYRASSHCKQLYVSFLQRMGAEVCLLHKMGSAVCVFIHSSFIRSLIHLFIR